MHSIRRPAVVRLILVSILGVSALMAQEPFETEPLGLDQIGASELLWKSKAGLIPCAPSTKAAPAPAPSAVRHGFLTIPVSDTVLLIGPLRFRHPPHQRRATSSKLL